MNKTRVSKGEAYWFVDIDGKVWDRYERNEVMDSILFSIGNYFHTKKEAEQMNEKFLAILKGADVIEMPSEEEIVKEAGKGIGELRYDGFLCGVNYVKTKIVK